jgi:hypothetical protein
LLATIRNQGYFVRSKYAYKDSITTSQKAVIINMIGYNKSNENIRDFGLLKILKTYMLRASILNLKIWEINNCL